MLNDPDGVEAPRDVLVKKATEFGEAEVRERGQYTYMCIARWGCEEGHRVWRGGGETRAEEIAMHSGGCIVYAWGAMYEEGNRSKEGGGEVIGANIAV